ncbi:transcriptional regulator [Devosia yakushimensis]|uniref:Transcriptional regulator n=1 Tax=Devosia yakushimensis TaxID=470028 RepID=A0ABQ5U872_9HYPH|nr:DJ-1/PfpI family protein [Devosia yakushimensis]GLQ08123.1 transcriptional regulator [Devosia yakushimensis]
MKRVVITVVIIALALGLGGFGIWVGNLPPGSTAAPMPVPATETAATLQALAPRNERPVIAIIGLNDATETTDYLMPAGILRRADIADVQLLATEEGPVSLYPALSVLPDATIAAFDAAHPQGADYVIVPAMSRDDDPAVMAWLREQADKGSTIISVCAGAKVAAAAGLLEGRRGTTHWFYLKELLGEHPGIHYVADRRFVVDGRIASTTGISASIPMALTLIEAIAGRARAEQVADEIGVGQWDASHDSSAFRLTRPFVTAVMGNVLAFWQREEIDLALTPDFDAVSLALVADAWSRTYRSRALTSAPDAEPIADRDGIRILPDRIGAAGAAIAPPGLTKPAAALDATLAEIAGRYGGPTANVVAMQLEYPAKAL